MKQYRFTNLRRRDDRVSQWVINNVLCLHNVWPRDDFLKLSALARWVNWPPTLSRVLSLKRLNLVNAGRLIDNMVACDDKAWTGAYMIRPAKPPYAPMGKGLFVATVVIGKELNGVLPAVREAIESQSLKATCEALQAAQFWGPFMAGQVAADWAYTPLLAEARDLYTWAPQGPGSRRGYNRLLGRPLHATIPEDEWCGQLQEWRGNTIRELGAGYNDLTLGDIQNALCEVDKYLRVRSGEGRPRAVFKSAEGLF